MKILNQPTIRDTTQNIGGYIHGDRYYICPVCNLEVTGRTSYYDPYYDKSNKIAAQVHFDCLSVERMNEIKLS